MNTDFRIAVGFTTNRKTLRLISEHGLEAAWHLIALWEWVAAFRPEGDLVGMTDTEICFRAGWKGDPKWPDWLRMTEKDGNCTGFLEGKELETKIHDWAEHNGWVSGASKRTEAARFAARIRHEKRTAGIRKAKRAQALLRAHAKAHDAPSPAPPPAPAPAPAPVPSPAPAPVPLLEEKAIPPAVSPSVVIALWNEVASRSNLVRCLRPSESLVAKIRARMKVNGWLEAFTAALPYMEGSDWTNGRGDRPWRADLEFMCKSGSAERYANRQPSKFPVKGGPGKAGSTGSDSRRREQARLLEEEPAP